MDFASFQQRSNSFSRCCVYTSNLQVSQLWVVGLSYKSMQFFMVACFLKFVKFSPNVCMLVVLVVKVGRRNVLACRKKIQSKHFSL